jgi:isopentenyldiphosphate isomerase
VLAGNVHADLRQLSYGNVTVKSYDRYDINGFHFCSTNFEASHPLVARTNTGVVTRVADEEGHETKYYRIIKNRIKYNFARNKKLKTIFFDCDWFHPNRGTQENQLGMVEVKHADWLSCCDLFIHAH